MGTLKTIFRIRFMEGVFNNIIASLLVLVMMVLVVSNIVGRYLFDTPVHGALELTEFMMVGIVYFTLAYTQAEKSHIRVELILGLLSRRKVLILDLFAYVLGLVIIILITWQGVLSFLDSWEFREATDGYVAFPIYPAKAVIPVGCFLFCVRLFVDIIDVIKQMKAKGSS